MAQNYHQNPHSQKRNLQQMRARVIFRLVWDFRARPFSLFLGSFLGAKKARFLTWPQKRGFPTPKFLFRAPASDAQKTAQTHPRTRFAPVGKNRAPIPPPPEHQNWPNVLSQPRAWQIIIIIIIIIIMIIMIIIIIIMAMSGVIIVTVLF